MKKKFLLLVTAILLVTAVLSACGKNTQDNSQSSSTSASSSPSGKSTSANGASEPAGKTVEIRLMAKDFEYDQKVISVKKGDHVKIILKSDDGGHGFTIPDYNVNIQGNGSAEFTASKAGTFEFHCSVVCGSGHPNMKGKLIVE